MDSGSVKRTAKIIGGKADTLIFRNENAGFSPPYFKFDSAALQAMASGITRACPDVSVEMHGYGFRVPWLDMFPNATSVEAPERCLNAPSAPPVDDAKR
jgi:hypothetical protein